MEFIQFIAGEGLIMIAVLYIIGQIIKNTKTIPDKWIPVILLVLSILLTPLVLAGYTPENIVQAILIAGATVFSDQVVKQSKKGKW